MSTSPASWISHTLKSANFINLVFLTVTFEGLTLWSLLQTLPCILAPRCPLQTLRAA